MSTNGHDLILRTIEASYTKATNAELSRDFERAFRLYIDAAQNYMHLGRTTTDQTTRAQCKVQAGKALERAEKIKHHKKNLAPVSINHFSEQAQHSALVMSSKVNGIHLPLHSENNTSPVVILPSLSAEQKTHGAVWARLPFLDLAPLDELLPEDVTQHVVSDCSVCASISVCIDHNRRFKSKLGIATLQPMITNDVPAEPVQDAVRYQWLAVFNGAQRQIVIDDQLPCYPNGDLMCVSTGSKLQKVPSLIEKAYMALMGGYDFPGSDSCTDLHAMTGWIPEALDIRNSSFERERTWRRIVDGYNLGLCVLTLGTGETLSQAADMTSMSLKSAHCYAVVGIHDTESDQAMVVLNSEDHDESTPAHSGEDLELSMTGLRLEERPLQPTARSHLLQWDIVCQVFDGIYLSWSPEMFKQTLTFHGSWRQSSNNANQPNHYQLTLRGSPATSVEEDVWVLLTRHVIDTRRSSEFIALSVQSTQANDVNTMYMKGSYTSSTHVLVKARLSSTAPDLSLVCSYDGEYEDAGFTVTIYSSNPVSWVEESVKLPYSKTVSGAFTSKTAGGNSRHPTFMTNPQYHLRIEPDKTLGNASSRDKRPRIHMKVQGDRRIPFNITLIWSQGQRITDLVQNEIVATSGAYTYGFASIQKDLTAGDYTVIVSAFEPQHTGSFSFTAEGTHRFEIKPVPQEGAGMFSKIVTGLWTGNTATGGPSFQRYTSNPTYEIKVTTQTEVKIRLQITDTTRSLSINATLFHLQGNKLGKHITTSGPYSDARSGVVTAQVILQPGRYVVIPSTYNPGLEASFKLLVYSSDSGIAVTSMRLGSATAVA